MELNVNISKKGKKLMFQAKQLERDLLEQ